MLAAAAIEAWAKSREAPQPAPAPLPPQGRPAPAPGAPSPRRKPAPRPGSLPPVGDAPAPAGPWTTTPGRPAPATIAPEEREGVLMLRAMIAAARADGQVDAVERARIAEQLDAAGLGTAAREAVLAEFDRPAAPEQLAREARDPMLAAQLYAAAVAGAAGIEGAERAWLDAFARALRLDRPAVEAIERRIRGG
jgi:uncharacterized membrane protein YebE (DUF533 family)